MDKSSKEWDSHELRNFGLIMGAMLILFFGLLLPWIWGFAFPLWPWGLGGVFCGWGLVAPKTLAPVHSAWMRLAHVLGWINTCLMMSLVFYLLILPTGLVMRLLGRDPMKRGFDANVQSYRVESKPAPLENLERPF